MYFIFDLENDPCQPYQGYRNAQGYGQQTYLGQSMGAHRVAYVKSRDVTVGSIMGMCVRHKCDNPCCVNPNHLELGTWADTNRDRKDRAGTVTPRARTTQAIS